MTQTIKVIKNLMKEHGMSQKYMAEQIGVSNVAVCKWMQGKRNPDIQYVEKMAKVLGYKLSIEMEKGGTMEPYKVEMELNLKTFIAETKEVTQALNKLVDDLEQIEKRYAESQESEAYSFPEVFGEPIEMLIDGVWVRGKVIDGYRSRDGIVNMEGEDGKKYWCGCSRTECYRQPKEDKE